MKDASVTFDPDDDEAVRTLLSAKKAELERLIKNSKEARAAVELDQTRVGRLSRMDALQGQAMALETDRRRGLELQKIEGALRRLEDGEYGACVRCSEEVEVKRLELDPAATLCFDCASSG